MRLRYALLLVLSACGGSTPPPDVAPAAEADGVPFQDGDVLSYVLKDAEGRLLGRSHGRVVRGDGQLRLITRVAYGDPPGATVEYASTLRDDFSPLAFKKLSSTEGRLQLIVKDKITIVTDIAHRKVDRGAAPRALVLAQDDFLALAAAIRISGLKPGNSGRLEARVAETGQIEMVPIQVFANAQRQTIVKTPDGKATLDGRGYVKTYERGDGSMYVLERKPSDPPKLLPVPQPAVYERPRSASWEDQEVTIDVEKGRFAGVLSVPKLRAKWGNGLAPGIIFINDLPETNRHGFGTTIDTGRWELCDRLAEEGFAVLRLDDRGVGESRSEVPPSELTVDDRVADVEAIYDFLKRQQHVDPERIVVIGHGFGALEAAIATMKLKLPALVLMSPAYRRVAQVLAEREIKVHGTDPVEAERRMNVLLTLFRGSASAETQVPARVVKLYRHAKKRLVTASQMDVDTTLAGLEVPIAVIQGLKDFETSWKHDAQALERDVNKRKRRQAKLFVYADADHMLKNTPSKSTVAAYADRGRRLEPKMVKDLAAWLTEKLK